MKKHVIGFLALLFLLGTVSEVSAVGVLFVKRFHSTETYQKVWIKSVDVTTTIRDQIASTHMDEIFHNDMNWRVEAFFVFPLPEKAVVTRLVYWYNGKRYEAAIRERQQAVQEYEREVRRLLDPALLEHLGNNLFRLRIAPVDPNSDIRFEITYTELLSYDFGAVTYKFFLNTTALSPKPLERVSLSIDAQSQFSYKMFRSPSHEGSTAIKIEKLSDKHYTVVFGDENFYPDRDFILKFETVRQGFQVNVLTYKPVPSDSFGMDSFYVLWITPPDSLAPDEIIPKNIVFVADVSGSMEGERLSQLKEAMNDFLDHLRPKDRFNIISFGTNVVPFHSDLVPATPENISAARTFVFQLYAVGLTNIDLALKTALGQSFGDSTLNTIVFLTDGYPTWGEMNIAKIVEHAQDRNTADAHLFTFGVGDEVSRALLADLAYGNGGYPTFITADDSIALVVRHLFERISKPVLTNLKISIEGLQCWDWYPKTLPDLFWGSQVLELGRYRNGGQFTVTLRGKIKSDSLRLSQTAFFPDTSGGDRFVPRLWAQKKINYLMGQIQIYGEKEELVDQVIDLSLRYGILTPYTAFISNPNNPPGTGISGQKTASLPNRFALLQNYPNPFNQSTQISYVIPEGSQAISVSLKIYDLTGKLIKVLVHKLQKPGLYRIVWNGTDHSGIEVASGVYLVVLDAGPFHQSRKLILLK
ncbi:MAG: VWA domain-containing protein [Calditrichaeota bacterium]|nr:VWA domain-containing protein [Calditrichota bacterium]